MDVMPSRDGYDGEPLSTDMVKIFVTEVNLIWS